MKLSAFYFELALREARSLKTIRVISRKRKELTIKVDGFVSFLILPQRQSLEYLIYVSIGSDAPLQVRREPSIINTWVSDGIGGRNSPWLLCDHVYAGIFLAIKEGKIAAPLTVQSGAGFAYLPTDQRMVRFNRVNNIVVVETQVEIDSEEHNNRIVTTNRIAEKMGLAIA